ncbi:MAG: hypothetical protein LBP87_11045, partial [Planctomycetaceae bacterium]|nr:hypothetical protein [Planctomycetaceae bacterium]
MRLKNIGKKLKLFLILFVQEIKFVLANSKYLVDVGIITKFIQIKNTNSKINNIDKKLYKFALIGLSNSGKTCILTAMGMERRPTTESVTCAALPAIDTDSDDIKQAYVNLQQHKVALEVGKLPQATPTSMDVVPKYRYTYSDSQIGEIYFEIHDYAGELLNPSLLANGNEMVNRIRNKMRNLDGIIVLAVTPDKNESKSEIPDEIHNIIQAFNSLHGTATNDRKTPIAFVLTKWDRQSPIEKNSADIETERLEQFFDTHESFKNVLYALRNNAGEEHFKIFPISALGHCTNNIPDKIHPLASYGLPYPFGWLVRQINELDLKRLENLTKRLPKIPIVWRKKEEVDESLWLIKNLINRLPENDNERRKIVAIKQQQIRKNIKVRFLSFLTICIVVITTSWYFYDGCNLSSAETTINTKTDTSIDEIQRIQNYLMSYKTSGFLPFLRLHSEERIRQTDVLLTKIAEKYEIPFFNAVEESFNNKHWEVVVESGDKYKKICPNGQRIAEVVRMITSAKGELDKAELERKKGENTATLKRLEISLTNIRENWKRFDKT